jgi:hypothetical protein
VYVCFIRDGVLKGKPGFEDWPGLGQRVGKASEFRLCEQWTSSAKSVFQFDVQGQVATSSHAGIPWLKRIRDAVGDRVHFWPFDGWVPAAGKAVIAEVYPSIFRNRYERAGRTPDEQDAYAVGPAAALLRAATDAAGADPGGAGRVDFGGDVSAGAQAKRRPQ